jgi:HSP20 family protein
MTANRPRGTGDGNNEGTSIEVLYTGSRSVAWMAGNRPRVWRPPTDVYETDEAYVVQVEISGAEHTDFDLSLDDRHLTVTGGRDDSTAERRAYHQMEIRFGDFCTEVELPGPVDKDRMLAEYHDGFLVITLPRIKTSYVGPR